MNLTRQGFAYNLAVMSTGPHTTPIHWDKSNQLALVAWMSQENSRARFNPFDTEWDLPGATDYNPQGVKNYPTQTLGISAFFLTLTGPNAETFRYPAIVEALRIGNCACAVVEAVARSSWGTWEGDPAAAVAFMLQVEREFSAYGGVLIGQ